MSRHPADFDAPDFDRPDVDGLDDGLDGIMSVTTPSATGGACRSARGTYAECPLCGGALRAEHAHFRCAGCGWRDSCCD